MVASSLSHITEGGVYLHVGPEIGVASTKAFTGQLSILYLLNIKLASNKKINEEKSIKICIDLQKVPTCYERIIESIHDKIKLLAKTYKFASFFISWTWLQLSYRFGSSTKVKGNILYSRGGIFRGRNETWTDSVDR